MVYKSKQKMIASNHFYNIDWATFLCPIYLYKNIFIIIKNDWVMTCVIPSAEHSKQTHKTKIAPPTDRQRPTLPRKQYHWRNVV